MAKLTGLGGMIRGKSGPNVYRVSRGVQTMSQYNPNPNNPNSELQRDSRSIFGTSAKMAKAAYQDKIAGPLFKSVSFKSRNDLISKIINSNLTFREIEGVPEVVSAGAMSHTWTPGFNYIPSVGAVGTPTDIEVDFINPSDGSFPIINGFIVCLLSRSLPGMNSDDSLILNLPVDYNFQCLDFELHDPVKPGATVQHTVDLSKFKYLDAAHPFDMPNESTGIGVKGSKYRCWYIIPFSYEYQGVGLEINLNGSLISVGHLQHLWSV